MMISEDKTINYLATVQLLLSFGDNSIKSALAFLITFGGYSLFGTESDVGLMISALALVCPFVLFSGMAGIVAERFSNAVVIKMTRKLEIPVALITIYAIYISHVELMLVCLLFYSVQSAFFTTAKLAFIPQVCRRDHLISANAKIQSATLIGILAGLIFGGLMIANDQTSALMATLVVCAIVGYLFSRQLPVTHEQAEVPNKLMSLNPFRATGAALVAIFANRLSGQTAILITWFWTMGFVLTTLLPDVAESYLNISANSAILLIAAFVAGVAIGGIIVSALAKPQSSHVSSIFCAVGMALCSLELSAALASFAANETQSALPLTEFTTRIDGLRIIFDLILIAAFGAGFVAPLYALLQSLPSVNSKAIMLSGSVTLDATLNTIIAAILAISFARGLEFHWVLSTIAAINLGIAIHLLVRRHQNAKEVRMALSN